ncbi:MAG: glycosyltransferase family 2 protein [Sulfitobacter sp.]
MSIAAVVIGRNEGARLMACLEALAGQCDPVIYVDSGSSDGSVEAAQARGAQVVALDMSQPFTAARARNAGLAAVPEEIEFIQFLDGDCVMRGEWLEAAAAFLRGHAEVAVVCGRRREVAPEASVYNRLIDAEWDTPVGEALACGGDALMRAAPLRALGGYRAGLIAGEEPELCLRLRAAGWRIWRLQAEMTLHDAQIMRFGQWWQRSKRAGFAFAEGAYLHGRGHWGRETRRALIWGIGVPFAALAALAVFGLWGLAALLIYPAQLLRLARRGGWDWARFSLLGRFAEAQGAMGFYLRLLRGGQAKLIEYK